MYSAFKLFNLPILSTAHVKSKAKQKFENTPKFCCTLKLKGKQNSQYSEAP